LQCNGSDEMAGGLRHHDLHVDALPDQQANQFCCLVCRDAAGNADQKTFDGGERHSFIGN
jgi:hypothetical protein